MFCDNASYQTDRDQYCANYCGTNNPQKQVQSFQYIPTQQTQRNPSNVYKQNISRNSYQPVNQPYKYTDPIISKDTVELVEENTKKDYKKLQAVERNKNISAILSIVLAFTERCETLKEKLCGYPAQSFSPVDFFNVLDITEKGFVDLYDVKRFVNNEKIRQKDIIALFKRVNGDHSKDNTKLTYFGYLNLIKPYFNQQLARDLLLRDTLSKKGKFSKGQHNSGSKITGETLEVTQQSVLLLFQELILLHCICATEHEQAKQMLMNDYMLNAMEIKQILGMDNLEPENKKSNTLPSKQSPSRVRHKTTLSVIFDFIENNSQFEIEFKEMKLLLAFLNCHEFSLTNDKYISLLFLPTNCKAELIKEMNKRKQQVEEIEDTQNYMNTYLTRQNLLNKGDVGIIRNYLDQRNPNLLSANHVKAMNSSLGAASKANFLQFVHPRSLQRVNQPYQDPLTNHHPSPQQVQSPHLGSQHPQFHVNASNKYLSNNPSGAYNPLGSGNQRMHSNSSSIPQQNIKVIPPRQSYPRQDYQASQRQPEYRSLPKQPYQNSSSYGYQAQKGLKNEFYQHEKEYQNNANLSKISNSSKTPFLEQFMKRDNVLQSYKKDSKSPANYGTKIINEENSRIQQSGFSESAFQVVDYGYEQSRMNRSKSRNQASRKYADQSQKIKRQTLDSRYNMVVSQYKGKPLEPSHSSGPNFLRSTNRNHTGYQNSILDTSKGNVMDSVGLSQSNVVNESNLLNKFAVVGANSGNNNILNQFFKKA